MFKELKPLIDSRSLTLTIVSLPEGKIRVCVVPQSVENDESPNKRVGHRKEVARVPDEALKALTTPLSLTGSPEELDDQLPGILAKFVEKHIGLQQTLERATSQIDEAVKAIEEREKEKTKAAKTAKRDDKKDDKADGNKKGEKPEDDGIPSFWCAPASTQAPADTATQSITTEEVTT